MAGKRGGGKGKAARRKAQMDRLAASSGAGDARRERARDEAAREAAAGPSAARWLVPADPDATLAVAVDVVADLLALDPRTTLQGRGNDRLRGLAGQVVDLAALDATTPSGRPLIEVVTDDEDLRSRLRPSFDLAALLGDAPVAGDRHDRVVRTARALLDLAARHRAGTIDLYEQVAPVGGVRHPRADEVEATVRVATDGLAVPAGPDPAVVTPTGGWIGVAPVELFLTAGRGLLTGGAQQPGGAALAAWLERTRSTPEDGWWMALRARLELDAAALLQQAAARAGSDHPDVVAAPLVELIALRHPIAPPS